MRERFEAASKISAGERDVAAAQRERCVVRERCSCSANRMPAACLLLRSACCLQPGCSFNLQRPVLAARRVRAHLSQLLGDDAVLALPSAPGPAPEIGLPGAALDDWRRRVMSLTCIAGLGGLPQVRACLLIPASALLSKHLQASLPTDATKAILCWQSPCQSYCYKQCHLHFAGQHAARARRRPAREHLSLTSPPAPTHDSLKTHTQYTHNT